MLEEEYQLDYFRNNGLVRRTCTRCGASFWTRDPDRTICGDAPCEPYNFIGNPFFTRHSVDEMREAFLSFFEREGHTRIARYPVAARWRDDIYLTIASIADFQPYVTSGVVPPPANPLTISQPCIRLNDLDSVGRSGRHLTLFEMMAHHAFNTLDEEIYWKDRTVELCDKFLASLGADLTRVSYKEHPWIGGGNAGPSVEVLIGGLEVATLVFMNLGRKKTGAPPIDLDGEKYYPMPLRIVDTGYGLERLVWASRGSPTIYDAVFPEMVSTVMEAAGLAHNLDDPEFTRILAMNAKVAGLMDISGSNLFSLRKKVAAAIDVPIERLDRIITPVEKIYAIVDHTRCLAYMLGDCIVPSNVREGYLARLVIRRTLRMLNDLKITVPLPDLVDQQLRLLGPRGFEQDAVIIREILEREVDKYSATMARGTRIVQKIAKTYKAKTQRVPLSEVITLYDSHGIPPEIVREVASAEGAVVDIPDNFYSLIAEMHSTGESAEERAAGADPHEDRIRLLPATRTLFYEQPCAMEFESVVIDSFDDNIVLDQTLFYPEGGGQPCDLGTLITAESMVRVEDVRKKGDVILHTVSGGVLRRGERVKGIIDEERRWSLMRHHTATHIILHAAKEVLGAHIHQAGAQKDIETSRIDLRHYTHITPAELYKIEVTANRLAMEDRPTEISVEDRTRAEQKYGFSLYQGGVPPGREIRVVRVAGDIEACAGTHCISTGQVGPIRLIRVEHIQDGIERIEFAAGLAAVQYNHQVETLLARSAEVLSVQQENLPPTVSRFFEEWKEQKKEIERLSKRLVELEVQNISLENVSGVPVLVRRIDLPPRELTPIASGIAEKGGVAFLASSLGERVHVVIASGSPAVNAGEIVSEISALLGGKGGGTPKLGQGGGPGVGEVDRALRQGRDRIAGAIHG